MSNEASQKLVIVFDGESEASETNLAELSAIFGVKVRLISIAETSTWAPEACQSASFAMTAVTARRALAPATPFGSAFSTGTSNLFVYGFEPQDRSDALLSHLAGGACRRVMTVDDPGAEYNISAGETAVCGELAGLTFGPVDRNDVAFDIDPANPSVTTYCRAGDKPLVWSIKRKGGFTMVSGAASVADPDAPFYRADRLLNFFSRLAPPLWFLRRVFGESCWHTPLKQAAFIIDDPLLRPCYGHLDYRKLLASMQRAKYSTSIAFIPWNYRRTDRDVAGLFKAFPENFSICVHGCDHTGTEFATRDERRLRGLTEKALWRMEEHERLTGLPFSPVMVFPKGAFSPQAMRALGDSRFLAVVNTEFIPTDCPKRNVMLRDLLEPAITRFSSLPMFIRRYPENVADCVMDAFLGKPIILVEHHRYLREGFQKLEDFVSKVQHFVPKLHWTDLQTICSSACSLRTDDSGRTHARFWTNVFRLKNQSGKRKSYMLERRAAPESPFTTARVNGKSVEFSLHGDHAEIPIVLESGAAAEVILEKEISITEGQPFHQGSAEQTSIRLRRWAFEFRDNVLDRNATTGRAARAALDAIRRYRQAR